MLATTSDAEDRPASASDDDPIEIVSIRSSDPSAAHVSVRRVGPDVRVAIGYGLEVGAVARASSDLDRTDDLTAIVDARMAARRRPAGIPPGLIVAVIEPSVIRIATRGDHVVAIVSDDERAPRALTHLDRSSTRSISAGLVAGSTVALSAGERPIPPSMLAQRHLRTATLAESIASVFGHGGDHAVVVARCLHEGG